MEYPCEECIVKPMCQTEQEGKCPDLNYWTRRSTVERYLETHPNSRLNDRGTFHILKKKEES